MSSGKVIPSIPDINRIEDPVARDALTAIVDGWQVRNGDKGNGDHAFLTKADLKDLIGTDNYKLLTATDNGGPGQGLTGTSGARTWSVAKVIRDLQNEIGGSPLSVYLSEKIGLIDRPKTGVLARIDKIDTQFAATDSAIAAIQTQQTTLTNAFAAQANLITTVQSRLDNVDGPGSYTTIEQKFSTLVTKDFMRAQYTVKVDLSSGGNHYVVGFGLSAEDNGNGPSSLFLVRADRFAIGAPGLNPKIPFIVRTDPHYDVTGVFRPDGAVYITTALMGAFVADTGNIKAGAIGSLQLGDESVTVASTSLHPGGANIPFNSWLEIGSVDVDFFAYTGNGAATIAIQGRAFITGMVAVYSNTTGAQASQFDVRALIDGVEISNSLFGKSVYQGFGDTISLTASVLTSGKRRISMQIRQSVYNWPYYTGPGSLIVQGVKK